MLTGSVQRAFSGLNVRRSLLAHFGVLVGATALVALSAILGSLTIAEAVRGNAAAINLAGSLRMLSYRLVAQALAGEQPSRGTLPSAAQEFERRLTSLALASTIDPTDGDDTALQYRRVQAQWEERIRPLASSPESGSRLLAEVIAFQGQLDVLVKLLEEATERRIGWLRNGQFVLLFVILALLAMVMHGAARRVAGPMRELLAVADGIRARRFEVRAQYRGEDELGLLAGALNAAASDLDTVYRDLEVRVNAKTAELTNSNRALGLLYGAIRLLHERPVSPATLADVLALLKNELGCAFARLELVEAQGMPSLHEMGTPVEGSVMTASLAADGDDYGRLELRFRDTGTGATAMSELLDAVARHVAVALAADCRRRRERRVMLMEERQAIARDLHDSMAQALSYLMIQVTLLDHRFQETGYTDAAALAAVGEVHTALDAAYRQLRQLLDTFRLQPSDEALKTVLQRTLVEFQTRGAPLIDLEMELDPGRLTPNQELHVLQIVREALANVTQHAQAGHARVALTTAADGAVVLCVEDDGKGLPEKPERRHHYGMAILRERATMLGGELDLEGGTDCGTRVSVRFNGRGEG